MSDSERSDIEFAMLAHQVHLPGWTHRQPTPQEWMISALRVLLGTAVTAAAGMSAAAITFLIVAVFPLHGINYLIEHQTVIDESSASPVVRFWLNPSVLNALSTVLIGGVGLILAMGVGLQLASKVKDALPHSQLHPRRCDAPREN